LRQANLRDDTERGIAFASVGARPPSALRSESAVCGMHVRERIPQERPHGTPQRVSSRRAGPLAKRRLGVQVAG
jgi:hypothetical protein